MRAIGITCRMAFLACIIPALALSVSCTDRKSPARHSAQRCGRIISFAPSITETLYALGLGDRVVGVTRFCTYPPQAAGVARIGGYLDPNYEMILSLKPDVVFTLKEHGSLTEFLDKNGISHTAIDNENLEGILASFKTIGDQCGHRAQADSLIAAIEQAMAGAAKPAKPPRVLLCIGRESPGSGTIAKIFAAGPGTFYSQLIDVAGGTNAYTDSSVAYPSLSGEGIARLSPDIVIDAMASVASVPAAKVRADWDCLSMVPAVKNHMVFCLTGDYVTIPGPRIALVLRDLNQVMARYVSAANPALAR